MRHIIRLIHVALTVLALVVPTLGNASATTLIYFNSPPGDYIGGGITRTYTEADGAFSASTSFETGVRISFSSANAYTLWNLEFTGPVGMPFDVGNYELATRSAFHSPTRPGLDISGDGRGCNTLTGRFTVREIARDLSGTVLSFAADFTQSCDGMPPLKGVVRFNSSLPAFPPEPIAAPGPSQTVREGDAVALDGSNSYDLDGSIAAFKWTQLSGPPLANMPSSLANPSFTAPTVAPGGADIVLALEVTDNAGLTATSPVSIHVQDSADQRNLLYFHSLPGDYIGSGVTKSWSTDDGAFTAKPRYGSLSNGVEIDFNGSDWWSLDFAGIAGTGPLVPGTYLSAERAPFNSAGHPGLDVSGNGRGCNGLNGRFTVLEAVYGSNNDVLKFAADFEQHCDGPTTALFGSVRFNSGVPLSPRPPSAYTSAPTRVPERSLVAISAAHSIDPQDSPLNFHWTQISGPQVTLVNPDSNQASFTAPDVPAGGADLSFRVDVTNGFGLSDAATATVHVLDGGDAKSVIYFRSQEGDYVGGNVTATYYEWDGAFSAQPRYGNLTNGVRIGFSNTSSWWYLEFAGAADTGSLVPGTYLSAERAPFNSAGHPGLDVSGNGRGCNTLTGRFTVLEAVYGSNNDVLKFAADFEQHCEGATPALFGSVRFNSAIPASPSAPIIGLAVGGNTQATVSFAVPVSNGDSSISGYVVASNPAGGVDSDAGSMALTHRVTGLTNGVTYTFTVKAINARGAGPASAPSNAVTPNLVRSVTGSVNVTAAFTGGGASCGFASASFIPMAGGAGSPPTGSAPKGEAFVFGLFDFRADGCETGSNLTFTLNFPRSVPRDAVLWRYGPTSNNSSPHWYEMPATIATNNLSFSIVDGGLGDDDRSQNGSLSGILGVGTLPKIGPWLMLLLQD